MTLAVTGGTGFVGQALLDRALGDGLEVRALARRPQAPRPNLDWVAGDLADRQALSRLCAGAEAVVHVAGVVRAADPSAFEQANVTGTLNVIAAARAAGVPRLVFVSSLSAREPGLSHYGASKARAEKLVKASGLDWTIVRPPAVYGPRDREMLELFKSAKWGIVPAPAEGRASVIHVEDLARLLLAMVLGGETASYRVYEPDDGRDGGWDHYDLARAIAWAVGRRRPLVPRLSRRTMEWVARADTRWRGAHAKLTLDRVGYLTHPDWVARRSRGVPAGLWEPRIDTREGLKATARWYRQEGWL